MLTGDKVETAKCIAISTGLKSRKESIFEMQDLADRNDIALLIDRFSHTAHSQMLMVDGTTL